MIVGIKDSLKLIGVIIVSFCTTCVCALFINYNIDLAVIESMISGEQMKIAYDAISATGKVVCFVTGGCLSLTGLFLLIFYINQYISRSRKVLGILKAMGYSDMRLALGFSSFGLSVLIGTALGVGVAWCMMSKFYSVQNEGGLLPTVEMNFHFSVVVLLIIIPSLLFSMFAIFAGYFTLKRSAYDLLRDKPRKIRTVKEPKREIAFLNELRRNILKSRPSLLFFIAFGGFCFAAMVQMSMSMEDYSGKMMTVMMLIIGLVLAFMSLLLSLTSVIKSNAPTAALMHALGYSQSECRRTIIEGYRPFVWGGFGIGTAYQYGLLKLMVNVVFKDFENITPYKFNIKAFLIAIAAFLLVYEAISFYFSDRIRRIPVKSVVD